VPGFGSVWDDDTGWIASTAFHILFRVSFSGSTIATSWIRSEHIPDKDNGLLAGSSWKDNKNPSSIKFEVYFRT
jgi:hypothetical protein